jgi:hypothetical protein
MKLGILFCLLLTLLVAEGTMIRVANVTECVECGCPNLMASDFAEVEYIEGYEDVGLDTNMTVFLKTENWYVAVHSPEVDLENLTVCASVVYTYDGSFEALVDATRVCMDLDTLYYDIDQRRIIDPEFESTNLETGTLFFLYNAERESNGEEPLVLGCDYCDMALQTTYFCNSTVPL